MYKLLATRLTESLDESEVEAINEIFTELLKESRNIDDSDYCITNLIAGELMVSKLLESAVRTSRKEAY